jgi:hypothetical protein
MRDQRSKLRRELQDLQTTLENREDMQVMLENRNDEVAALDEEGMSGANRG